MKIYDCFMFFNELELLDLRLMELSGVVDYFVLVEANTTHTGKPKPYFFEENKDKFSDYINKIIHVKVDDLPQYHVNDIWKAENYHRNCIARGLESANSRDVIIVSDADEIPSPAFIEGHARTGITTTAQQKLYYYYVNCLQNQLWNGSIACLKCNMPSPQHMRNLGNRRAHNAQPNGGWHYSFMGGAERIVKKVENIAESHMIIDKLGTIEEIQHKMNTQTDLWNRTVPLAQKSIVDIAQDCPKSMGSFLDKYPHFFYGEHNI